MAEAVAGSLVYQFKADIADLKNGFANIQTELTKVKSGLGTVNDNFKSVGKGAAESIGLARHEMINLSRQVADVGVSLASGQSPFMVLIQQGAQIKDVFSSSKATFAGLAAQFITVGNMAKIAALGIVAIGASAYSSLSNLEKLSESAKTLGTNTQALRGFNRQASILGVDPKELNDQMVALAQRIREAQTSGGELAEKLGRIGINIKSFDLSKPGEFARLFAEIAEKVRNGSNEIDKLNALKLIGFSSEMLRVFSEGGAAIDTFVQKSRDAAENSTTPIRDKWKELRTLWDEISSAIAEKSIDIISGIVDFVKEAINQINTVIDYVKGKFNELTTFKFSDEKGMATNSAGSLSNYENRLGLQDKQKLPDINVNAASKPKSVDLSGIYSQPKSKMDKGVGSQVDPLKSYIDSLKEAAAVSKAEADNWALGNVEKAKAEALAKANVIASREGKTLTDGMRQTITEYATGAAQAKLQVENLRTAQQGLNQLMSQFADTAINAFDGLMDRSKRITDVLRDLVKMLANNALKGVLTGEGAFGQMMGLGGKNGNTGGILGMLANGASSGGGFSSFLSMLPKFAAGGTLGAGKWGIAGEAGPELIQGPATITPQSGKAKIQINNYAGADVQARQMNDGQIVVMIQQAINANNKRIPGIVADAQRRSM